jgi:hypothetical protein
MSRKLMFAVIGSATAIGIAASALAQNERAWNYHGWRTAAYKTVNGGTDTDRIYLPGAQRYHNVRLCSMNAPIRMRDFDIYFANGQHQDVEVRERITPGTCTRAVNLHGNRGRDITLIRLKYGRIDRSMQRPVVRVQVR